MKGTQRKATQRKHLTITNRTGSREDEWISSKARFNTAIQSVASATRSEKTDETEEEDEWISSKARFNTAIQSVASATRSEKTDETEEDKEKEREQRSRMYSVKDLLESRYSVESESEKEKEQQSGVKARKSR